MKKAYVVLAVLLAGPLAYAKDVTFEAAGSVGGIIVQGDEAVSASPVAKGDFFFNLGQKLSVGASVGQALNFNQKDPSPARIQKSDNGLLPAGLQPSGKHHGSDADGDTIFITNNVTNVTVQPALEAPATYKDMTESNYFFGEPFVRFSQPLFPNDFLLREAVKVYVQGFYGVTGMKIQSGGREFGTSYGFGGGVEVAWLEDVSFRVECLKRKIEIEKTSYDHLQLVAGISKRF